MTETDKNRWMNEGLMYYVMCDRMMNSDAAME